MGRGRDGERKRDMLRAMDSAVAGLRAHQNKMDVVGHNLANVNTFGFKAQTYNFKEAMYQTSTASTGGTATGGGVNAAQYGYGTLMGSIGVDMTASTPSYVGGFNASINGEGFFLTRPTKTDDAGIAVTDTTTIKEANFAYTRVGQFFVDSKGYVVDANGNFVYGFRADGVEKADDVANGITGGDTNLEETLKPLRVPIGVNIQQGVTSAGSNNQAFNVAYGDIKDTGNALVASSVQINSYGEVMVTVKAPDNATAPVKPGEPYTISIGKVTIATFQNPNGMAKAGQSYYSANKSDNTGDVVVTFPGDSGSSNLMTGYIEASNVDLANEFATMITTHRGFQANSKMITVSDEMLSDLISMKR